jgi:outer membrane protein TolC
MKNKYMKYILLATLCALYATNARAQFDPLSVYTAKAPQNCISRDIDAKKLSLPDLINIGICNNPTLGREFMSVKISESEYGASKSEYLPDVSVTGSINDKYNKTQYLSGGKTDPYAGNVAVSWLLYDFGGRSARVDQVRAYLDVAQFSYNAVLKDTILSITQSYFDVLSSTEVLKSTQSSEESFKKSYEESKRRFELGLVALSDKLLAETSYEQSKLAVVQAENAMKNNMGQLAVLLNLPPDTTFNLQHPPRNGDISKLNIDMGVGEMMDLSITLRDEMKGRLSTVEATKQGIQAAKSAGLPSISVGADAGFGDDWRKSSPYKYNTSIGLSLSFPLFTGFSNTYAINKATQQFTQANFDVAQTSDQIKKEVWTAYQNYLTAVSSYEISKKVLASAVENERVAFASYEVGKGSILNLLTATSQHAEARQERIVSFYNVLISKSNLYRAIGRF